jgi:hypothetical protein
MRLRRLAAAEESRGAERQGERDGEAEERFHGADYSSSCFNSDSDD